MWEISVAGTGTCVWRTSSKLLAMAKGNGKDQWSVAEELHMRPVFLNERAGQEKSMPERKGKA